MNETTESSDKDNNIIIILSKKYYITNVHLYYLTSLDASKNCYSKSRILELLLF